MQQLLDLRLAFLSTKCANFFLNHFKSIGLLLSEYFATSREHFIMDFLLNQQIQQNLSRSLHSMMLTGYELG